MAISYFHILTWRHHPVAFIKVLHRRNCTFATHNSSPLETPLPKDLELARRAAKAWKKYFRYHTNRCLRQAKRLYEAAADEARLIGDPIAEIHFRSQARRMFEFWRLKNGYMTLSAYEYSHLRLPASYKKGG